MNSRINDTEECIIDLEYRIMEIPQSEQKIERQIKKTNQTNKQKKRVQHMRCVG